MTSLGLDVYLNDHVAGATAGLSLARFAAEEHRDGPLGGVFSELATEIEEDHRTLERLLEDLAVDKSTTKAVLAGIGSKLSRPKFAAGAVDGPELGTFLTLEALSVGVEGKLCMWKALAQVGGAYAPLASYDLERLCERAANQRERIEELRLQIAPRVLAEAVPA